MRFGRTPPRGVKNQQLEGKEVSRLELFSGCQKGMSSEKFEFCPESHEVQNLQHLLYVDEQCQYVNTY